VHGEMGCFCNQLTSKYRLKLRPGFKSLHLVRQPVRPALNHFDGLDRQTLAAFGAARSNNCAATACFHARQETVGACALDFGGLVCAFHDVSSYVLENPGRSPGFAFGLLSGELIVKSDSTHYAHVT